MYRSFVLSGLALKEIFRSPLLIIGSLFYLFLCASISLFLRGGELALDRIRFYLSLGWFLSYAYALAVSVSLPLRSFSREKEEKLTAVLRSRPISAFEILIAKFLAASFFALLLLFASVFPLYLGSYLMSKRSDVDLSFFRGHKPFPLPPREVSSLQVEELRRELARDPSFSERYSEEELRRIAQKSLSVWRAGEGESLGITWEGLPSERAFHIRLLPRIYPPWSDAYVRFEAGGRTFQRRLRSGVQEVLDLPENTVSPEGKFNLRVEIEETEDRRALVTFVPPDGITLLFPETSFLENLLRAALLGGTVSVALAAFGVLIGSTLSYSVGVLAVFTLLLLALGTSLFTQAISEFTSSLVHHHGPGPAPEPIPLWIREIWKSMASVVIKVFPSLGSFDVGLSLGEGRLVLFRQIASSLLVNVFLRGGSALGLAYLIFRRQEPGRRA